MKIPVSGRLDFESFKSRVMDNLANTEKEFLGLSGYQPPEFPVPEPVRLPPPINADEHDESSSLPLGEAEEFPVPQPVRLPPPMSAEEHAPSSSAAGEDEEFMQAVDQLVDLQQAIVGQVNEFTNRNQILIQSLQAI